MTRKYTITMWVEDGQLFMQGDMPQDMPTDSYPNESEILYCYLSAHAGELATEAVRWFGEQIKEAAAKRAEPGIAEAQPKIILPNGDGSIQGV